MTPRQLEKLDTKDLISLSKQINEDYTNELIQQYDYEHLYNDLVDVREKLIEFITA